jgi:CubicO group peptidase (beta-lactamase class C family)
VPLRVSLAWAILLVGWLFAFTPPADGRPLDPVAMDRLAEEALRSWDVPGVAVVIVTPDRVLWLKGYGRSDVAADRPVTPDTVFPLASCSKAFTTALAAMLVDEGKLAWDDPVRKHLPEFHLADPAADAGATFRDLFTHRTGLASHDFLWYRAPWPLADIIRRAGLLPVEKPFRTAFQYQSVMYSAAGLGVARAGGDSWETLVRRRIFEPLGMTSARCTTPPETQRATPYRAGRDGQLRAIPWYTQADPNPAGSVHVSARDLATWLQFQLGGKVNGRTLVSAAALEETHTPQIVVRMDDAIRAANPDTLQISYGLGWVIQDYRGHLLVSHGGVIDGFRAHITLLPRDGFALAILSNRHLTRMNLALSNALVDRLLGLTLRDWNAHFHQISTAENEAKLAARKRRDEQRRPGQPPTRPLTDYTGEYEHPAYGNATLTLEDGLLKWSWSTFRGGLAHHHADVFELTNEFLDDPLIEFRTDEKGRVTEMAFLNLQFQRKQ